MSVRKNLLEMFDSMSKGEEVDFSQLNMHSSTESEEEPNTEDRNFIKSEVEPISDVDYEPTDQ